MRGTFSAAAAASTKPSKEWSDDDISSERIEPDSIFGHIPCVDGLLVSACWSSEYNGRKVSLNFLVRQRSEIIFLNSVVFPSEG